MYEIYAYGNNDSLYGIFNAIAAIMGANSYLQAIAMVAFCGFVTAGIAYAFMPHKLDRLAMAGECVARLFHPVCPEGHRGHRR